MKKSLSRFNEIKKRLKKLKNQFLQLNKKELVNSIK